MKASWSINEGNAHWFILTAAFFWGTSFIGSKVCLTAGMLQFETVFYRFLIASVLLFPFARRQLRQISRRTICTGLLLGFCSSCTYTFEMFGLTYSAGTASASFLASTSIVMVPFLYALFFKRPVLPVSVLAAAVTTAGVICLSPGGRLTMDLGSTLLLISAFWTALGSVTLARPGKEESRLQLTLVQFLTITLYTGVMTLIQGRGGNYPPEAIAATLYQALGPTLLCFVIKNSAMKFVDPIRCTMLLSTEGVFCAGISVLLFHDRITAGMVLGIVLILCGIFLGETKPQLFRKL